jgi:hypothetical protein
MAEQYVLQWRSQNVVCQPWHEVRVEGTSTDVATVMEALERVGYEVTCAVDAPPVLSLVSEERLLEIVEGE